MAVINYKKEQVSFDYKVGWETTNWAIPSIEFFIHVWQRANTLQDVSDTVEHAFEAHGCEERYRLVDSGISARAARWRAKGVALQRLTTVSSLDALKRFAQQEAI